MALTPGRFRIRQAGLADMPALASVKAASWRETYAFDEAVFGAHDQLAATAAERWAEDAREGAHFWAVVDTAAPGGTGAFVGLAHACPARDPDAPQSLELAVMYLRRVAQGSGIADRLLEVTVGDAPAYLWVLAGNERAIRFYARHGFELDGASQELGGALAGHRELRMSRD